MTRIAVTVNGIEHELDVEPRRTLADVLREDLALTGTHLGCEHGVCGACTVLVDGATARACLMLAVQADGQEVTTVEGLADPVLVQACVDSHSFQCGFCTPGFLAVITEFLAEQPDPTESDVRKGVSGSLCRCTGYQSIVDGVLRAASVRRSAAEPA